MKYTKLQKYNLITVPLKTTNIRGLYDNKFLKLIPSEQSESFEMNIYKNISNGKRKQLRPSSVEIYMAFYDVNTMKTSLIPNYKIFVTNYGDNEIFKLTRGEIVINNVTP